MVAEAANLATTGIFEPPVQTLSGLKVEVVRDERGMLALRQDWDRMARSLPVPSIYSTFEWLWGWWHIIAPRQRDKEWRLHVLVVRLKGEITGIVPLAMRVAARAGVRIRKLEFIGGDDLPDYQSPLFGHAPEAQARAAADYLSSAHDDWDILELHNLRRESADLLQKAMQQALAVRVVDGEPCPFFSINEPWSGIAQRKSKLTRQTLQNQRRRIEREGICVRIVERPDAEPGLLGRMAALESRKLVGGLAGNLLLGRWPQFFDWLFKQLGTKGWISVAVMEKQDQLIAYNLFFRCGRSIWDYAKAFDPAYAKLSPGSMLLSAIVDYGHAKGYREYDFLRGAEPYKLKWATGVRQTFHLQAWHAGLRSRALALVYLQLHRPAYRALVQLRGR
jgi:CelD/BcsL family acetyltransferase involved in cellulose biosynthesis